MYTKIGVAGPVGSGKTALIEALTRKLSKEYSIGVITNDIYTKEDAEIPRKGGPGITRSDLLVINKTDLAPMVGADLGVMERDSKKMRGDRPFIFTNIRGDENVNTVVEWIKENVLF